MDFDFTLLLVIAVGVTGVAWLFDSLLLRPGRRQRVGAYLKQAGVDSKDWASWQDKPVAEGMNESRRAQLTQASELDREPLLVEYAKSFFPVLLAVLVIRAFLFEPFQIPTGSMIPTLKVGDYIVVNKFSYGVRLPVIGTRIIPVSEPKRGDVMVFIPPHDPTYYIKRVIGLPGDHVRYEDKVLYINGEPVPQQFVEIRQEGRGQVVYSTEDLGDVVHDIYKSPSNMEYRSAGDWLQPGGATIPEGHYFMMGDNRDNSLDSRSWGPVSEDKIVGKAVAVWMHWEPGSLLPGFGDNRLINN